MYYDPDEYDSYDEYVEERQKAYQKKCDKLWGSVIKAVKERGFETDKYFEDDEYDQYGYGSGRLMHDDIRVFIAESSEKNSIILDAVFNTRSDNYENIPIELMGWDNLQELLNDFSSTLNWKYNRDELENEYYDKVEKFFLSKDIKNKEDLRNEILQGNLLIDPKNEEEADRIIDIIETECIGDIQEARKCVIGRIAENPTEEVMSQLPLNVIKEVEEYLEEDNKNIAEKNNKLREENARREEEEAKERAGLYDSIFGKVAQRKELRKSYEEAKEESKKIDEKLGNQ